MSTERSDASGAHEDSTAPDAPKDPFAILGVELDASDQDVRRAYAQAIRTARASGDAEAAQRVQWAFEAIRDPKGRGQWREHLRQRSQHAVLFERVDEALEAGDLARAFDQVRTILEISPDLERALSLAYALSRDLGHIEEATIFAKRLAQVNRGNRHHIGRFARALAALHGDAAPPWPVADLARAAGLSRSSVFQSFNARVGEPPAAYLTRWRMTLARTRLRRSDDGLAAIAERVGYGSEAAFSRAFKRQTGVSPSAFRRSARARVRT